MKKRVLPLLALILLLSMSCAACRSKADTQPTEQPTQTGENISTTEPTIAPTQDVTEAPDTTPTEPDWGMGEEDFDDIEKETEPAATEPTVTEPIETEPTETEPTETKPAATEPTDTEPSEPDWGMGGEDF